MADNVVIAVDAMGGDNAPDVVLEGVEQALAADSSLQVILCGPAELVQPFARSHERCTEQVTTQVIGMGEHPANAVRKKKDSSLVVGCRLVKEGSAHGFFSAGSTGACLAAGTLVIGRIRGISRPALATVLPSPVKPVVMCDVGANADCKPEYLLQFAQMATVYAEKVLHIDHPKAALLNIGEEETKGSRLAQEAHALLRAKLPNFAGNAEGGDLLAGTFDVIIADGFTGNACLKSIEGTAKVLFKEVKGILTESVATKLAAVAIKGGLGRLKDAVSPDTYGGAPLLGVKGACIVGHGSSNARAIRNGILTAASVVRTGVSEIIEQMASADDPSSTMNAAQ